MPQSRQRMVLSAYTLPSASCLARPIHDWTVAVCEMEDCSTELGSDASGPVVTSARVYSGRASPQVPDGRLPARASICGNFLTRGDGVEAGVRLAELEWHLADRPVAVLGDFRLDQLDLGVRVLFPIAVQEDHHVGVLLDRPGLAQVRQARLGRSALLDAARQLRKGHDRDLQLPRELLQTTA